MASSLDPSLEGTLSRLSMGMEETLPSSGCPRWASSEIPTSHTSTETTFRLQIWCPSSSTRKGWTSGAMTKPRFIRGLQQGLLEGIEHKVCSCVNALTSQLLFKGRSIMRRLSKPRGLKPLVLAIVSTFAIAGAQVQAQEDALKSLGEPLVIAKQGSFMVGGRRITAPNGQTYPIDHLYAQFQIPLNARHLPMVMVHGAGQTGKGFESTPDGREGFQSLFVRRGFAVYVVDF